MQRKQAVQEEREQAEISKREQEQIESQEVFARNTAFAAAFPTPEVQSEIISKYAPNVAFLDPKGAIVRNLAIGAWWRTFQQQELEPKLVLRGGN